MLSSIKQDITSLNIREILELNQFIAGIALAQKAKAAFAKREDKLLKSPCVNCGFACLMKWGRTSTGNQRFKCRYCKTTISTTTNTPVYRLRYRDKWSEYMKLLNTHISVENLSSTHFIGICKDTMLRWRHRFMSAFTANTSELSGVVQADEKFFRQSYKGNPKIRATSGRRARKRGVSQYRGISREQVAVLTAIDSNGLINQTMIGQLSQQAIVQNMTNWVMKCNVIVSDGSRAYEKAASLIGCTHIDVRYVVGANISRINSYHLFVENLVNRKCLGVSTKHLMKYMAWARHITTKQPFGDDMLEMMLI